ncbi:MAG: beta strand repeat-containing protein, partial [Polyangia bacterium]
MSLKTQANTDATAKANGKADEAGTVGIGAGVSVNSVHITNIATTGNATVSSNGLDVEAGMRVLGTDHIQRFDGSEWKTIESGVAFPEDPEDGDFFQLTQGVPGTTAVDGASQSLVATGSNLKVKSTVQFGAPGATGTFTIAGITGTCSYQVTDATNFQVTVCAGTPEDKATVTMNTSTKAVGAQSLPAATTLDGDQDLSGGTLKVVSLVGFDPSGQFTIAGIGGTCSYTGTSGGNTFTGVTGCTGSPKNGTAVTRVGGTSSLTVLSTTGFDPSSGFFTGSGITGTCTYTGTSGGNTFTGITGCSGSLKDNAAITRVAFAPGIYKWDDTTKLWLFQTVGIPTGTGFPTSPATGDYFQLTKAPSTTVKGAGQDLSSTTTLNVASTFGFLQTNGTFTGAGITGTCSYTGTTTTSFTGVTGCTGIPADGAAITAGTAAGIYKWNGSAWTFVGDGTALPETATSGDLFRLAEHDVAAEAESGAGGDKDTLSLAGSVAINIVSNHTEAIVPAGATVSAGTGDVTLKTLSNEEDTAKADSDAKSGKVGIGASVSVQVLNDYIVRSAIEDGATFSGGAALTISADSHHTVETEDKAGSEGGTLALSPSVSIAIVTDNVSAHLGTGAALTVTGAASITATEDLDSSLDSNAAAGGDNVAIGAAVAINVIETNTTADLARDLTAASLTIGATTTQMTDAKSESSSKGEQDGDKSADNQSKDQVGNNPNTSGKTDGSLPKAGDSTSQGSSESSSESGDSDSGGVNIAAAVSVNWARGTNVASIAPNVTVVATGAVKIDAEDQTGANSRAIGFSGNLQSDVAIGAGVGLNVEDITNTASIGAGAHVTGGGVTVEAVTPAGKEDDFIVWGIAAAGGKSDASIAASVGVQVLTFHTTASIGAGAHVTSTDVVDVEASQNIGLQNLAVAAALSTSGTAVGGAFVVNILPAVQTQAFIDAGAVVDAAKALTVKATSSINPIVPDPKITKITLPAVSSIAVAGGAGGGDAAVTGSVIVDVFSITTQAWIADNAQINQSGPLGTSAQTIDVEVTDTTHLINVAGALALSEGSAAVGVSIIVDVIDKDVGAWIGKTAHVSAGGDMSVSASSTENLFELAVAGGASEGAAVTGSILVVVLNEAGTHSTTAFIDNGAVVHAGGKVAVSASDAADLTLSSGNVAIGGGSAGVGASVVVLVRNGTVDAAVHQNAHVDADGGNGLSVSATQSVNGIYIAVGGAGGDSVGVAGSVVVDVMSDSTKAHVDDGVVIGSTPSAGLAVSATDTTSILSIAGAVSGGGTAGVGAGVDVEVVHKDTEAWLAGTVNATLSGDTTVDAASSESLTSIAVGGGFAGTAAVNVNVGVPVFNVTTDAYIAGGATVKAGGSVRVSANESLSMNVIGGNLSAAGSAAVGAAAAIPLISKETHAFIGDGAHVTAGAADSLTVGTGAFQIQQIDPR